MRIVPDETVVSVLADPARFTGTVWRTDYVAPEDNTRLAGSRFLYGPGSRSFWHVHESEQVIIAVAGTGLVAWEGPDSPYTLHAGDWWHVTPGVAHWHGAAPNTVFAHLAVTAGGSTTWLHEVAAAEYGG
jgi:quercetin dioxygenase-like cupin family protein